MEIGIWEDVKETKSRTKDGHLIYSATCKFCGKNFNMKLNDLKRAKYCKHIKTGIKDKRICNIFVSMMSRCYNEKDKNFRFYGEKGIKICEEWVNNPKLFEEWATKNGYNNNLTIDRKNSKRNYCPENCRWITLSENAKYKSTTITINVNGIEKTGRDWAKELEISTNIINTYRRKYGMKNTAKFIKRALKYGIPKLEHGESYYEKIMPD